MQIGSIDTGAPVRLAPMADVSNVPFRLIARRCGSGMTTSEEVDAEALIHNSVRAQRTAEFLPEERPVALQLLGGRAESMAEAANRLQDLGADMIDVNMGCPVRKIVKKGKGSALMRDLPRTAEILSSLRKVLAIPLTIKIRGGWDDEHLNAVEVAQLAESEGVDAITVHPRTRSQQFTGLAPWQIIGDVVDAVNIPVTGNGDVDSMAKARRMMAETNCQAVMIGRGAMGRPWVFSDEYESLGREAQDEYRLNVISEHMELIEEHLDERRALIQMKKNLSWYISTGWRARFRRRELFECVTAAEAWDVFRRYWDLRLFEEEKLAAAAG